MIQNDGTEQHTLFHYGQQGELLGETQINSADTSEASHTQNIVWLQMRPVVALDSSANSTNSTNSKPADTQISWLHSDHLLTARAATDANQNLIWRWHSDAFGVGEAESFTVNNGQNNQNTEEPFTLNLRFPGQYHDQESGLHYNYHRTYDPSMGRYTQSDPIGLRGGINAFAYVGGSPVILVDPLGLKTCLLTTVGWLGVRDHAAIYTSRGNDGTPALYDPAGSYGAINLGGSSGVVVGAAASIEGFKDYHKSQTVVVTCKSTSQEEEESIIKKAIEQPSAAPFECAEASSNVLHGHPSFNKVEKNVFLPGTLEKQVRMSN